MDRQQRYLLKQQKINNNLFCGIMFIIGAFFYISSFYINISHLSVNIGNNTNQPKKEVKESLLKEGAKDFGEIIIGAAAVTLIFGWANRADFLNTYSVVITSAISKAINPMINFINQNSIYNYRYDCFLAILSQVHKVKYGDDYLLQRINLSFARSEIDEDMRVIFAIGNKDGVLKDYFDDERYIVNYKIECKEGELDIKDELVCSIQQLSINGNLLNIPNPEYLTIKDTNAKEYVFKIPEKYLNSSVTIEICFSVFKWVPGDKRIFIPKQIFETTNDSEFRISLSEEIGVKNIVIDTTEITTIHPNSNILTTVTKNDFSNDVSASIICRCPILPGSSIRFELQRV